jgi:hypothetical protein
MLLRDFLVDGGLWSSQSSHSTGNSVSTTRSLTSIILLLYVVVFICLWQWVSPAFSYLLSIMRSFPTCACEELLEVVQSNTHVLRLYLLWIEWIALVLNSHCIDDLWRFGLHMFVAVWVLSRLVSRPWYRNRTWVQFYLEFGLFLYHFVVVWIHGLARYLMRVSSPRALCLESLSDRVVLDAQSERELWWVMRHLTSFLWDNKTLALCLSSSICRRMVLSIYKLLLLAFGSIWIVLIR